MKTDMIKLLKFIIILMLFTSCGEYTIIKDKLNKAESLMQEYPDSSLMILNTIDPMTIKTERGCALYSLLISQAYDKNYIDLKSDSIIRTAVNYFANSNGEDRRYEMLSLYYLSRIYYNSNNLSKCVIANLRAEEIAKEIEDNFYLGMIYGTITDVYNDTHNAPEELKYAELSYNYFRKANREPYIKYAYLALAIAANNNKQWDRGKNILDNLYLDLDKINDSTYIGDVIECRAHLYWVQKNYLKAKEEYFNLKENYNKSMKASSYGRLAHIYVLEDKLDSAEYYIEKGKEIILSMQDSTMLQSAIIQLYKKKNNYKKALEYKNKQDNVENNTISVVWNQSVIRTQSEFFKHNLELTKKLSRRYNYIFLWVFIAVLILSVSIIIIMRQRAKIRRINMLNDMKTQELRLKSMEMSMTEEIDTAKEIIITLRERLKNEELAQTKLKVFFNNQFDVLRKFSETSYSIVNEVKKTINKKAYSQNENTINDIPRDYVYEFGNNPDVLMKIEEILNITNNGIIEKLRNQLPKIKEDNMRLLIYLYAGFSNRAISTLMKIDIDNVYRKKYKLKDYILKSDAPDKDLFLSNMK